MSGEGALIETAGAVGRRLIDALEAARERSGDWRDEPVARKFVFAAFDEALGALSATGVWGEANRLPSSELWRIAGERLSAGELLLRARNKPRGYAGDYEMLAKIVADYRCAAQPGRLFDEYFQTRMAPQAVRNRTAFITNRAIEHFRQGEGSYRIVSVGSGPALDVAFMLTKLSPSERKRVAVTLIDLDPAALDFARGLLAGFWDVEVRAERENLFRLAKSRRGRELLAGVDFSICSGFLDYLEDADAAALLAAMYEGLSIRGELIAFNFSPANACRDYMEWIGNWYLIYRDQQQFAAIAEMAAIPSERSCFGAEATGSDLYLSARR
jgi:extracellular factor (EF) 3-hydroxypalmitic acid methyl ester biosynthesis protein